MSSYECVITPWDVHSGSVHQGLLLRTIIWAFNESSPHGSLGLGSIFPLLSHFIVDFYGGSLGIIGLGSPMAPKYSLFRSSALMHFLGHMGLGSIFVCTSLHVTKDILNQIDAPFL
ncbi:hypothetical protein BS47DRAFT_364097 [Hydnum rufescens UP504]|uniref:Uncharacterized protein n=1 Tax=Hydnum rufescens UP504 TaxID=1448309 RepID=A0A9P6AKK4_9AGAM|nr:hypothetical protein BS47DRAFT_364097 [Hydnum rufescens UP504]